MSDYITENIGEDSFVVETYWVPSICHVLPPYLLIDETVFVADGIWSSGMGRESTNVFARAVELSGSRKLLGVKNVYA